MTQPTGPSIGQLIDWSERFRKWTRTEEGAAACMGVAEGSLKAEIALLKAFVDSIRGDE